MLGEEVGGEGEVNGEKRTQMEAKVAWIAKRM